MEKEKPTLIKGKECMYCTHGIDVCVDNITRKVVSVFCEHENAAKFIYSSTDICPHIEYRKPLAELDDDVFIAQRRFRMVNATAEIKKLRT